MSVPFHPEKLSLSEHGELYHDHEKLGPSLVASTVAYDLMQEFDDDLNGNVLWRGVKIGKI